MSIQQKFLPYPAAPLQAGASGPPQSLPGLAGVLQGHPQATSFIQRGTGFIQHFRLCLSLPEGLREGTWLCQAQVERGRMRTAILCQQGLAHTFTGSQKPVPPHGLAQWEFLLRASFPALCSSEIPPKFQRVTAGGSGSVLCHQGGSRSPSESDHPVLVWGTCAWGLLRQGQLGLSGQKRIFLVSSSRAGLSKAWGRELLQGMPAGVRVPATAPSGRRPQGPFCLCWSRAGEVWWLQLAFPPVPVPEGGSGHTASLRHVLGVCAPLCRPSVRPSPPSLSGLLLVQERSLRGEA